MKKPAFSLLPEGYASWLNQLKRDIAQAQQRAALAVNAELITLYHWLGSKTQQCQHQRSWGAKAIGQQFAAQLPWFHIITLLSKSEVGYTPHKHRSGTS